MSPYSTTPKPRLFRSIGVSLPMSQVRPRGGSPKTSRTAGNSGLLGSASTVIAKPTKKLALREPTGISGTLRVMASFSALNVPSCDQISWASCGSPSPLGSFQMPAVSDAPRGPVPRRAWIRWTIVSVASALNRCSQTISGTSDRMPTKYGVNARLASS